MVGSFELGSDRVRSLNLCLAPSIVRARKACSEDAEQCLDESGSELFFQGLRPSIKAAWQVIQHNFVSVLPQGYEKPKTVLPKDQLKPLCLRLIKELDLLNMPHADEDPDSMAEVVNLAEEDKRFMRHMKDQTPEAGWTADTFGPAFLRCFGSKDAQTARLRPVNDRDWEPPSELAQQAWQAAAAIALSRFQSSPIVPSLSESEARTEFESHENKASGYASEPQGLAELEIEGMDMALGKLLDMGFDMEMSSTALQLSNGDVAVWYSPDLFIMLNRCVVSGCNRTFVRSRPAVGS